MLFHVHPRKTEFSAECNRVVLFQDLWDDFSFKTLFKVKYYDADRTPYDLGYVQIGYVGMQSGKIIDKLPSDFDELENSFFSLGSSEVYYEKLNQLDDKLRIRILKRLHDLAYNLKLFDAFEEEEVVRISFLREKTKYAVRSQLHRMAQGGARLTEYNFSYRFSSDTKENCEETPKLNFKVLPDSTPPTNVHVLIGRNGIGKTFLLKNMIRALLTNDEKYGVIEFEEGEEREANNFANILCVAYSPFDDFSDLDVVAKKSEIPFQYIGLNKHCTDLLNDVNMQFLDYFKNCIGTITKTRRWKKTVEILGDDPAFNESQVLSFPAIWNADESELKEYAEKQIVDHFSRLSSGHKVVLLITTACVDKLEEKSILFLDEPENHLHPPLLASFVRALTYLLINRNGVAVISTHSPVILQEVPKSCVWSLRRYDTLIKPERLYIETFGSSVSLITTEVFGLEITNSGFHKLIKETIAKQVEGNVTYKQIEKLFGKQLGNEAQALIRTMIANGAD